MTSDRSTRPSAFESQALAQENSPPSMNRFPSVLMGSLRSSLPSPFASPRRNWTEVSAARAERQARNDSTTRDTKAFDALMMELLQTQDEKPERHPSHTPGQGASVSSSGGPARVWSDGAPSSCKNQITPRAALLTDSIKTARPEPKVETPLRLRARKADNPSPCS